MSAAYFRRSYGGLRGLADRKSISQDDATASLLRPLRRCLCVIPILACFHCTTLCLQYSVLHILVPLQQVMKNREDARLLSGIVKMDDAYLDDKRSGCKRGKAQPVKLHLLQMRPPISMAIRFSCE